MAARVARKCREPRSTGVRSSSPSSDELDKPVRGGAGAPSFEPAPPHPFIRRAEPLRLTTGGSQRARIVEHERRLLRAAAPSGGPRGVRPRARCLRDRSRSRLCWVLGRYLQTLVEIGAEQSSTIVFPLPLDMLRPFVEAVAGPGAHRNGATDETVKAG